MTALENLLKRSGVELDEKTHHEIMDVFVKQTTNLLKAYKSYQAGETSRASYGRHLILLAETIIMAMKKLPQ